MITKSVKTITAGVSVLGCITIVGAQESTTSNRAPRLIDPLVFGEDTVLHTAGYFDASFINPEGNGEEVFAAKYAPIVHFQYKDWLLFEAEGEFEYENADSTEKNSALEYASLNFFLNDNLAIGVGKYLSPVGQFVQNIHPSWINKLPSAPNGFSGGHGGLGATPNADFGIQARGGIATGDKSRLNYAFFVGNGPNLIVEELADGDLFIEGLELPAKFGDENSDKTVGGRLGFLPIPNLEVGFSLQKASAAFAGVKAADEHAEEEEDDHADEEEEEEEDDHAASLIRDRDYDVWSMDFYYAPKALRNLTLRGEFASTKLGQGASDEYDPLQKRWEAWYAQASYLFGETKVEAVLRYGDYSPADGDDRDQWAGGLNYVLSSNSILKCAYEFYGNQGQDRLIFQYAYGF